jgi:hypothetical protein
MGIFFTVAYNLPSGVLYLAMIFFLGLSGLIIINTSGLDVERIFILKMVLFEIAIGVDDCQLPTQLVA